MSFPSRPTLQHLPSFTASGQTVAPATRYQQGDPVDYYSQSRRRWIQAVVTCVEVDGGIGLDVNPKAGMRMPSDEQAWRIRPHQSGTTQDEAGNEVTKKHAMRICLGDRTNLEGKIKEWSASLLAALGVKNGEELCKVFPGFSPEDKVFDCKGLMLPSGRLEDVMALEYNRFPLLFLCQLPISKSMGMYGPSQSRPSDPAEARGRHRSQSRTREPAEARGHYRSQSRQAEARGNCRSQSRPRKQAESEIPIRYLSGDLVDYYSESHGGAWIPAVVTFVDVGGAIGLDVISPASRIPLSLQAQKIRPRFCAQMQPMSDPTLTTMSSQTDCRKVVEAVVPLAGAIAGGITGGIVGQVPGAVSGVGAGFMAGKNQGPYLGEKAADLIGVAAGLRTMCCRGCNREFPTTRDSSKKDYGLCNDCRLPGSF